MAVHWMGLGMSLERPAWIPREVWVFVGSMGVGMNDHAKDFAPNQLWGFLGLQTFFWHLHLLLYGFENRFSSPTACLSSIRFLFFYLNISPEQSEDQQCGGCEEVHIFHLFFNCYYFINVSFAVCLTWILKTRFVQTFFGRGF